MKKLYQTQRMRRFNATHARAQFRRRVRFRQTRRHANAMRHRIRRPDRRSRLLVDPHKDYAKLRAPTDFRFLHNPEGVVDLIAQLEECFSNRKKVFVNLSHVEKIDHAATVVLLPALVRFKAHGIGFNGSFPASRTARRFLVQSGFFKWLLEEFEIEDRYRFDHSEYHHIHTHAWKNVDSPLGDEVVTRAAQAIWGEKRRCQGVQRVLIELMQNTNNHADIERTGEKHWWLSVHHPKNADRVCFSFIDFGVGIFTSLQNKSPTSKFFRWPEKLCEARYSFSNNAELLRLILNGTLHQTSTKKSYRGKGLPGIHDVLTRNQISSLHIISNNVFANLGTDDFRVLPKSFNGTLVCWEVTRSNASCK